MTRQLPLALRLRDDLRLADFVPGANAPLLGILANQLQPGGESQVLVSGAPGSGRSHLLMGQCRAAEEAGLRSAYLPLGRRAQGLQPAMLEGLEQLDLLALDDTDSIAGDATWEHALFALYNRARGAGTRLLFSALGGPNRLGFDLADLRSRLAWGLAWHLQALDDAGQCTLLRRLAARRGLDLEEDVARYLLQRGGRGAPAMLQLLDRLDSASLAEQRQLTIPFVRRFLDTRTPQQV